MIYRCKACGKTFTLKAVEHKILSPLMGQVSFHHCTDELFFDLPHVVDGERIQGVGDLIAFYQINEEDPE
jgi:hypothetical protein